MLPAVSRYCISPMSKGTHEEFCCEDYELDILRYTPD